MHRACLKGTVLSSLKWGQQWGELGAKLTGSCCCWDVRGVLAVPSQGPYLPCLPSSCCQGAGMPPQEGLQHSWHTAALTPHALFTRIRMQSGLAAGLADCRQLSGSRDLRAGLLLRALPTAWPFSILPVTLWSPIPRAFTVSRSQKMGEHSLVQMRWQRSVKK